MRIAIKGRLGESSPGGPQNKTETFEKCSILFKSKEGENFNHRHTLCISRIKLKLHFVQNVEPDARIGQNRIFFKDFHPWRASPGYVFILALCGIIKFRPSVGEKVSHPVSPNPVQVLGLQIQDNHAFFTA